MLPSQLKTWCPALTSVKQPTGAAAAPALVPPELELLLPVPTELLEPPLLPALPPDEAELPLRVVDALDEGRFAPCSPHPLTIPAMTSPTIRLDAMRHTLGGTHAVAPIGPAVRIRGTKMKRQSRVTNLDGSTNVWRWL